MGFEPSIRFSIISCKSMNSLMNSKQLKRPETVDLLPTTSALSRHPPFDRKSGLKAVIVAAVLDAEYSDACVSSMVLSAGNISCTFSLTRRGTDRSDRHFGMGW
jgi:hypothetical protein